MPSPLGIVFFLLLIHRLDSTPPPRTHSPTCGTTTPCNNEIFCNEELKKVLQMVKGYDSNPFDRVKLKDTPENILKKFKAIETTIRSGNANDDVLRAFVEETFEDITPEECKSNYFEKRTALINSVTDDEYKKFTAYLISMWSTLIVQTSKDAQDHPDRYWTVPLPNCHIRNEEHSLMFEYWEIYWSFRGLLTNDMLDIAAGILKNLAYSIKQYGSALVSNRISSIKLKQPPLFALLVNDYISYVSDYHDFLGEILPSLEEEFLWWYDYKRVVVTVREEKHYMFQYVSPECEQRQEEDNVENPTEKLTTSEKTDSKLTVFSEDETVKITTEEDNSQSNNEGNREIPNATSIIPVELNSILEKYARLLSAWNAEVGDVTQTNSYDEISLNLHVAIANVLWNEDKKIWLDWDPVRNEHVKTFSPTNLVPVFTKSFNSDTELDYMKDVLNYLVAEKILEEGTHEPLFYIIPSSTRNMQENWNHLYGLPSQNLLIIHGLQETEYAAPKAVAYNLAGMLVKTCYEEFKTRHTTLKTYSATELSRSQKKNTNADTLATTGGHPATNGSLLLLFNWYGKSLKHTDYDDFPLRTKNVDSDEHQTKRQRKED